MLDFMNKKKISVEVHLHTVGAECRTRIDTFYSNDLKNLNTIYLY